MRIGTFIGVLVAAVVTWLVASILGSSGCAHWWSAVFSAGHKLACLRPPKVVHIGVLPLLLGLGAGALVRAVLNYEVGNRKPGGTPVRDREPIEPHFNPTARARQGYRDTSVRHQAVPVPVSETPFRTRYFRGASIRCPVCAAPMRPKRAYRGGWAGNKFWGCSRYPHCEGLVNR